MSGDGLRYGAETQVSVCKGKMVCWKGIPSRGNGLSKDRAVKGTGSDGKEVTLTAASDRQAVS